MASYCLTPPAEPPASLHMHYTFWESEGDPATDPLLVWSNGGPGAGSEFGAFTELGPMLLYDASLRTADFNRTGVPTLFRNAYAWTKVVLLLLCYRVSALAAALLPPRMPRFSLPAHAHIRQLTHVYESGGELIIENPVD